MSRRDPTLDALKAAGIILVVIGHAGPPTSIVNFIYLFHMPLFFFVSGVLFKHGRSIEDSIFKRITTLYLPFVRYELVLILLHNFLIDVGLYGPVIPRYQPVDFVHAAALVLTFNPTELMAFPFWFFASLFLMSVAWILIDSVANRIPFSDVFRLAAVLAIAWQGFEIARRGVALPNGVVASMTCLPFFFLGTIYRRFQRQIPLNVVAAALCVVVLLLASGHRIDVSTNIYHNPFTFMVDAVIGIYMMIVILDRIAPHLPEFVTTIGTNTVPIMAFQFLGFALGAHAANMYRIADGEWILRVLFGLIVPLLLSSLLNAFRIDARYLTFRSARAQG